MPYTKSQISLRLVTALEILRFYAEVYANAGYNLAFAARRFQAQTQGREDGRFDTTAVTLFTNHLRYLLKHCKDLPVTAVAIQETLDSIMSPQLIAILPLGQISNMAIQIETTLERELKTKLFFRLHHDKAERFRQPAKGWKRILKEFPQATTDVEEMQQCFALSRYAGAVFHSVQTIEFGLLNLGTFLEVDDPRSGWTAVSSKLEKLVKTNFNDLSAKHQKHFAFIEQMQGTVTSLKNAWRNKISHAHGKLILLTSEFAPDVAEEIIMATRAFMRRLATELPK